MNNELCNTKNHENTLVKKYNCEHNICLECVKKCEKCQKIVKTCLRCTVDYYFEHCNFCNRYKCFSCSKQCNRCEDYFCDYEHECNLCKKIIKANTCLKCINNSRIKCCLCKNTLKQCEECSKIFVCSKKCYFENKNKNNIGHLCQMFFCDLCYDKNNNNIFIFSKENINEEIIREGITKNENISSERQISNHGNINILNNQKSPNQINNNNTTINNKNNIIITTDKKKVCCQCCNIF